MHLFMLDQQGTRRTLVIMVQDGDRQVSLAKLLRGFVDRLAQMEEALTRLEERHAESLPDL